MSQQIERKKLFCFLWIKDEFFQEPRVGFERRQSRLQPRRPAEQRRHLHGFHGRFQFLPGLAIVIPFPEIVTIREISEGAIERFLSAAHARFDLTKDRSGSDIGAPVKQIVSLSTSGLGCFIPGIDRDPETLTACEGNHVTFPSLPGRDHRDDSRCKGQRDERERARHRGGGAGHIDDQRP
jgi:hypothetical protein